MKTLEESTLVEGKHKWGEGIRTLVGEDIVECEDIGRVRIFVV